MKKVLVTGGAGFVGTHFIEHLLKNTDFEIVSLDRFDASGNPNRLQNMLAALDIPYQGRVRNVFWDLKAEINDQAIQQIGGPFDYIFHLAAGSHVDRSIDDPMSFFMDNCIGTVNLLNYARDCGLKLKENYGDDPTEEMPIEGKFIYFSTDEVYGPYPMGAAGGFKEWDRLNPNNPYAAAKAAAEMAAISFANTYRIPMVITNTMNIFGERQHPEKYIPMVIKKVLKGEKIYIHADKTKTQPGLRHYLHARNICAATLWVAENGKLLDGSGSEGRYNVVGDVEMDNLELAQLITFYVNEWLHSVDETRAIGGVADKELIYELVDFHSSRPGHDLRYALDGAKLRNEGFEYPVPFKESIRKMIFWTLDNKEQWL